MRPWLFVAFICCIAAPVLAQENPGEPAPGEAQVLILRAGESSKLLVPSIRRIALADPSVAEVRTEGKATLVVTAKAAGESELVVWQTEGGPSRYRIQVK